MALWEDLCGHTALYLVSWYLVSVTRDFSHKHIHTLSASLKCHQSVNYYSGRAIHPYNSGLWIQSQWSTYTHTEGARGCSTWLGFLMLGHSIVHWNTTEVPYCSEQGKGKKSPGITKFLPVSHRERRSPIQCQWALNPQGLNELVCWWLYFVYRLQGSASSVCLCVRENGERSRISPDKALGFWPVSDPNLQLP